MAHSPKFVFVRARTAEELENKVTNKLRSGALLAGGPIRYTEPGPKKDDPPLVFFLQAMLTDAENRR